MAEVIVGSQLLRNTIIGTLLPESDGVVCFSKEVPISTVLQDLAQNKILSAPVWDPLKRTHIGFVDMVDIVSYLVSQHNEDAAVPTKDLLNKIGQQKCGSISDISGRNPYCPVEGQASLLSAILMMAHWKVHRIPVINSEGELITLLTQSQVLRFIYHNMVSFGSFSTSTVEKLSMAVSPVVTVSVDQNVIDAFKTMHEKRISAVGIVDESGKLIGNISVSDLKSIGFDGESLSSLYKPISEFMQSSQRGKTTTFAAPVCVTPQSTYSEVVAQLVNNHIHRVYIVDDNCAPVGIVSQLEVLHALLVHLHFLP